jgi:hypothetical protein
VLRKVNELAKISFYTDIRDRASRAFSNPATHTYAEEYLNSVHENWRNTESALTRTFTTIVLLCILYFMLSQQAIGEVTILGVKFKDLSPIISAIPAGLAYYFYDLTALLIRRTDYQNAYFTVLRAVHPDVIEHNMELFLAPRGSSLWSSSLLDPPRRPVLRRIFSAGTGTSTLMILILPFSLVTLYALGNNIDKFGLNLVTGLSVVAVLGFSLRFMALVTVTPTNKPEEWRV